MKSLNIHPAYLTTIFCVAVIIVLISLDRCGSNKPETITEFYTDTLIVPGDPYPVTGNVTPKTPNESQTPVPVNVDTAKIIADYFVKRTYIDTLKNDSSALVAVVDTVINNRITGRQFTFQNRRETAYVINNTTVTHIQKQPLFRLGIGASFQYSQKTKGFDLGAGAMLVTRPGFYIGYNYGIIQQQHGVNVGWIVSFRKRK